MIKLFIALIFFLNSAWSSPFVILDYQFYSDSGSRFLDYSSSDKDAMSSLDSNSEPTVPTSYRGATLDGSSSYIVLPPNSLPTEEISISNIWGISCWLYPRAQGPIFYRKADIFVLIEVSITSSQYLQITFVNQSDYSTHTVDSSNNNNGSVSEDKKMNWNRWNYVKILCQYSTSRNEQQINAWVDDTMFIDTAVSTMYHDNYSGSKMYIGYDEKDFLDADIFMFKLYSGTAEDGDGTSTTSISSDSATCNSNLCSSCVDIQVCNCSNGGTDENCSCGDGYWDNEEICTACTPSACSLCDSSGACTSCTNNADIVSSCSCGSSQWDDEGMCTDCPSQCATCETSGMCTACSNNAGILETCTCAAYQWDDEGMCTDCPSQCATCETSGMCTACSNNAGILETCTCAAYQWDDGVICRDCSSTLCTSCSGGTCSACSNNAGNTSDCTCADYQWDDGGTCRNCLSTLCTSCSGGTCSECSNRAGNTNDCTCADYQWDEGGTCRDCLSPLCTSCYRGMCSACSNNAGSPNDCTCAPDQWDYQGTCTQCSPSQCTACDSTGLCTACSNNASNTSDCTCGNNQWDDQGTCKCQEGFYTNTSGDCVKCLDTCKTCSGPEFCTECVNSDFVLENGVCGCEEGKFIEGLSCESCPSLCKSCESEEVCFSCNPGAIFTKESTVCELNPYLADLAVMDDNNLLISFKQAIPDPLSKEDISVEIENNVKFVWSIKECNRDQIVIHLSLDEPVDEGTKVSVILNSESNRETTEESIKFKQVLDGLLHQKDFDDSIFQSISSFLCESAKFAVPVGIILSFLSSTKSELWTLIGVNQMLTFIPLSGRTLPENFKTFLINLSNNTLIINTMQMLFSDFEGEEPYTEASEYGYDSTYVVVNWGESITILIIVIVANILVCFLSILRMGRTSNFFKNYSKNFVFGSYLRFWIEAYLDLAMACLINIIHFSQENVFEIINNVVSITLMVSFIKIMIGLIPFVVILFIFKNKQEIIKEDDSAFHKKWGSLYYEFTNNNFYVSCFYVWFMLRRILYAIVQVFLVGDSWANSSINLIHSVAIFAYIVFKKPYKGNDHHLLNCMTEGAICIVFFVVPIFQVGISEDSADIIGFACILWVYGIIITIYGFMMYQFVKKMIKHRRKGKIEPENPETNVKVIPNSTLYNLKQLFFIDKRDRISTKPRMIAFQIEDLETN